MLVLCVYVFMDVDALNCASGNKATRGYEYT